MSALAVLLVVPAILLTTSTRTSAASTVLTILNGSASVARGTADFVAAADGDLVAGGDRVRTADASHAVITFFDGSTIEIEPASMITVDSATSNANGSITISITQTLGRTWTSVQRLTHADSRFELKTPTTTAVVRGTGFITSVAPTGETTLQTSEGIVAVSSQGQTVQVGAGQVTTVALNAPPSAPVPGPPPPNKLRFGMHSPAYLAVVDPLGRACGLVMPGPTFANQIPGCLASEAGVEPQLVDVPNAPAGTYHLVIQSIPPGGAFTATASAVDGGGNLSFNYTVAGTGLPGATFGSDIDVNNGPDGTLTASGITDLKVLQSAPLKVVIPSTSPSAKPSATGTPDLALFAPLPSIGFGTGPTVSSSPAPSSTATPSATPTSTPSPTPTPTPTPTPSPSPTPTPTPAPTPSPTPSPTASPTPSPTATPTPTPIPSPTPSPTATPTPFVPAPTPTPTPFVPTPTPTPTPAPTATATPTATPSPTPTATAGNSTASGAARCGVQPNCGPDAAGYTSKDSRALGGPDPYWLGLATSSTATRITGLDNQDDTNVTLQLPFDFPFYGATYRSVYPSSNGMIGIGSGTTSTGDVIPDLSRAFVAPMWEDLDTRCNRIVFCGVYMQNGSYDDGGTTIKYTAFEWYVVAFYSSENQGLSFEAVLYSDGRVDVNYGNMAGRLDDQEVTIGINSRLAGGFIQYLEQRHDYLSGRTVRYYPSGVTRSTRAPTPPQRGTDAGQPLAPTGLAGADTTGDSGGSVTLTWTPSVTAGVTEQRVYFATTEGGSSYTIAARLAPGATSYQVTGLSDGYEYSFFIRAYDGTQESLNSNLATAFSLDDTSVPPYISTMSVDAATTGSSYSNYVYSSAGRAPFDWSIAAGALPPGIVMRNFTYYGQLTGVPTSAGTYGFTMRVADGGGRIATRAFTITVGDLYSLSQSTITAAPASAPADGATASTVTLHLVTPNGAPAIGRSVSWSRSPSTATLMTTSGVTDVNGELTTTIYTTTAGSYTVSATVDGVKLTSAPVGFTGLAVTNYAAIRVQPTQAVGTGGTFGVVVALLDVSGNVADVSDQVSISIRSGTGTGGAVLGGTLVVPALHGIATFSDLSISAAGNGYVLEVISAPSEAPAATTAFNVVSGLPDTTAPVPPVITGPTNGTYTAATAITFVGTAEPAATVSLRGIGRFTALIGTASADPYTGAWSITWSSVSASDQTVYALATDAAGNVSAASQPVSVHVDRASPSFVVGRVSATHLLVTLSEPLLPTTSASGFAVLSAPSGSTPVNAETIVSAVRSAADQRVVDITLGRDVGTDAISVSYAPGNVTDLAGNALGLFGAVVLDRTAPVFNYAAIAKQTLTLYFDSSMAGAVAPADFAVSVNGTARAVSSAVVSGSSVKLTLASAVVNTDTVLAGYTAGSLTDLSGNAVASFAPAAVTNSTSNASIYVLTPASGPPGTVVTIIGQNYPPGSAASTSFGTPSSLGTVAANGTISGQFTIPAAASGTRTVALSAGGKSYGSSFTVIPTVTLSPLAAAPGATVTATGAGYPAGGSVSATVDGTPVTISPPAATVATDGSFSITFAMPVVSTCAPTVVVSAVQSSSRTVGATPCVTLTSQGASVPGTGIVASGLGFPATAAISATWDGTPIATTPASPTANGAGGFGLQITIPGPGVGGTAGAHTVTFSGAGPTFSVQFTVATPYVSPSYSPTIVGSNNYANVSSFPASSSVDIAWDGIVIATGTTSASGSGSFLFYVPTTAGGTHTLGVSTADGASATSLITVNPTVQVPTAAPLRYGVTITINGQGFHAGQSLSLTLDGAPMSLGGTTTTDANGSFAGLTFVRPVITTTMGTSHTIVVSTTSGTTLSKSYTFDAEVIQAENTTVAGAGTPSGPITLSGGSYILLNASSFQPGTTVTFNLNGSSLGTATEISPGNYRLVATVTALAPGITYLLDATDSSGNVARMSVRISSRSITATPASAAAGASVAITTAGFSSCSSLSVYVYSFTTDGTGLGTSATVTTPSSGTPGACSLVFTVPALASGTYQLLIPSVGAATAFTIP